MNVSSTSLAKSQAQEASETASQTKAEAAKGDQQAIRKLAKQQAAQQSNSAPSTPPPSNNIVDSDAGKLDVKA